MSKESRLGVKIDGQFVFACASCKGVAATLSVTNNDEPLDGGPMPDGTRLIWNHGGPAYRLEFIGVTTGTAPDGLVDLAAGLDRLDPVVVSPSNWELAAFCCRTCQLNYCRSCWSTWTEFDDGFYDCTRGRCPEGHEQELDD